MLMAVFSIHKINLLSHCKARKMLIFCDTVQGVLFINFCKKSIAKEISWYTYRLTGKYGINADLCTQI